MVNCGLLGTGNLIAPRRVNVNRSPLRLAVRLSKSAQLFDAILELGVLYRPCLSNAFYRNALAYCALSLKRKVHRSIRRYLLDRSLNEIPEPFSRQSLQLFASYNFFQSSLVSLKDKYSFDFNKNYIS